MRNEDRFLRDRILNDWDLFDSTDWLRPAETYSGWSWAPDSVTDPKIDSKTDPETDMRTYGAWLTWEQSKTDLVETHHAWFD